MTTNSVQPTSTTHTPLVLGVWMVAMMPLQFVPALTVTVGTYALAVMALGLAMVRESLQPALM